MPDLRLCYQQTTIRGSNSSLEMALRPIDYTIRHAIHQTSIVSCGKYSEPGPRRWLDWVVSQHTCIRV